MAAFSGRGNSFSVVYGRHEDPAQFAAFKDALTSDPQLSVRVERESEYFAEQSRALSTFVSVVGYGIAVLMALGALFGGLAPAIRAARMPIVSALRE